MRSGNAPLGPLQDAFYHLLVRISPIHGMWKPRRKALSRLLVELHPVPTLQLFQPEYRKEANVHEARKVRIELYLADYEKRHDRMGGGIGSWLMFPFTILYHNI